jgi:hypothetical protein
MTAEHHLRKALLDTQWKDILLVPQTWYPAHTPKYETEGWWYAPAEEVLGRTCKTCKTFCELTDCKGTKRRRTGSMHCTKCKHPGGRTDTHSTYGNMTAASRTRTTLTPEDSALDGRALRRSQRAKGSKSVNYHEDSENDCQSDEDYEVEGTHHCETTLRGRSSHNLVDHIRDGILSDGRAKHSCMYQGCEGRESL